MSGRVDDDAPDRTPGGIDLAETLHSVGLDRQRITFWGVAGLILLGLWFFAWQFVGTLIVGLFVYYVCRPLFARIHSRVHGRTVAVVVTLFTIAIPTLVLIGWTVSILVQAIADFLGSGGSEQIQAIIQPYVDVSSQLGSIDQVVRQIVSDPQQFQQQVGPLISGVTGGVLGVLGVLGNVGLQAFIVLVIVFYLLRDDVRLVAWSKSTFLEEGSIAETYLARVDEDLQNIFFGNILNALATGLIAVVSYGLLNLIAPDVVTIPQTTLVGLLVGVASLVPVVGIKIVTWPLGAYLIARSALVDPTTLWFPVLYFAVSIVVVDTIPDQVLRPYVSGRSLNVGAVMLAYIFGPILFGWYGIFLGPFLLVVVYDFGLVVVPWLTRGEEPEPPPGADVEPVDDDSATSPSRPRVDDEPASTAPDGSSVGAGDEPPTGSSTGADDPGSSVSDGGDDAGRGEPDREPR